MVTSFNINVLVDIRSYPGSRRYPWFNKDALENALNEKGIGYIHLRELGGRRKPVKDSKNNVWRNEAFRGYADYMETSAFKKAADQLQELASENNVAYMCSEAAWWRCHRALVSDYLKFHGWQVMHIMKADKAVEHPYTSAVQLNNENFSYHNGDLFSKDPDES
jgi:uncharacterized protein (DUF488 family)